MSATYLAKRLLLAFPTLFGVVVIIFVLLRVVPGDPIAMMIGPGATAEDIANLREIYGLDRSIAEQFALYLGDILRGDFGVSISMRQDVVELILGRLPSTLELAFSAALMAVAFGGALGLAAVHWRGRWPEAVVDAVSGLALAIPDFLWALLFILFFGVLIPVLPISGRYDPTLATAFATQFFLIESLVTGDFTMVGHLLSHLLLPAAALALPLVAVIARVLKTSLLEAITQDYVLLARVKGFRRWWVLVRHALPNALIPTITLTGVQFMFLVGGTVLVELIFSYPGIGNMAVSAVINRDLPLIQGLTVAFAVLFIVLNLGIDMTYVLLNPRVKHG